MSPTFRSLANPNYRLYAAGGVVSNVGTWMQRVAQDWLVLLLSGNSAAALGITTGLQFLPFLLLGPFAGLLADRLPKRRVLQLTNISMAVPALALGVLAVTGTAEIWHVYVLALVLGIASAFGSPARHAFVSEMVEPEDLTNAVGLNSASFNAARLVGPGLAGVLIAGLGGGEVATGWVILVNALTYAAPVLTLQRLDASRLAVPAPVAAKGLRAVREGIGYVRRRSDLLLVLAVVFFAGTFGLNFQMTSALMATEVFGKGSTEYGLLGSFLAVGSLAGSLVAARRAEFTLRTVVVSAVVFGAAVTVAGALPTYTTFALMCPVLGVTALTLITSANGYMQVNTHAEVRGRAMALYLMVMMGGTPLGAPLLGWVGEVLGARWTLLLGGGVTVVGVVAAVGVRWLLLRRPVPRFDPVVANRVA
ncbi:MFS transporter [Nocardioides daphniae]|uniref:MFS transporter n=1 Tax=Nocardioides daphniae TaxID=402297 RepID=A0A4V1CWP9_9ACTN|nr:MFS transporter [Nocardioides daphniae]QCC78027.1 MFS transporter [Nocardioides daphniae]GGD22936.1 MFS transporter [Nocardioides daphniae]